MTSLQRLNRRRYRASEVAEVVAFKETGTLPARLRTPRQKQAFRAR